MKKELVIFVLAAVSLLSIVQHARAQDDLWNKYYKAGMEAQRQGRYTDALKHFSAALKEAEKSGTPDERLSDSFSMLGMTYQALGKYGDAEEMLIRALETNLKIPAPAEEIVNSYISVAGVYELANKYEDALPWYEKALAFTEKAKGPEATLFGLVLYLTGETYFKLKQYDKAEPLYLRAVAIYEKAPWPKRSNAVRILESYITLLKKMNRKAEVKQAEQRMKEIRASK